MGFFWFLLIALAIYLVYISNEKGRPNYQGGDLEVPLDIIKKRYARGEITREQFEEMKQALL